MKRFIVTITTLALSALANPASSQTYPARPITIIVPFGPGGTGDLAARVLASSAQKYLNETVVVENKSGAGGVLGSKYVVDSPPDGYKLLLARVGPEAIAPALDPSTTYKWNDFTFLGMLEQDPFVCIVSGKSPIRTVADLIERLKKSPGKFSYASTAVIDATVVFPEEIFSHAGLRPDVALKVPYRNGVDTVTAILGGQVDFACNGFSLYAGGLSSGQLHGLVVSTPTRVPQAPDIPTGRELGMNGLEEVTGWSALYGPPGLPQNVINKWATVLEKLRDDPEWQARVKAHLSLPAIMTGPEARSFAENQVNLYKKMAPTLGIKN